MEKQSIARQQRGSFDRLRSSRASVRLRSPVVGVQGGNRRNSRLIISVKTHHQ